MPRGQDLGVHHRKISLAVLCNGPKRSLYELKEIEKKKKEAKSARFKNAKEAKVLALRNRLTGNRGEGLAKSAQHSGHGRTGNIATQSLWYLVPQAHQNYVMLQL